MQGWLISGQGYELILLLVVVQNVCPRNNPFFCTGYEELLSSESGCKEALELGYLSPKVYELIQIFLSFRYGVRMIAINI